MSKEKLVIGLMSGTSADGIDAVLTRITGCGTKTKVEQLDFLFVPFEPQVRERILQIAEGSFGGTAEICKMSNLLGNLYAATCLALCKKAGVRREDIDLIGNHGQTVWHMPVAEEYLEHSVTGTLQIGEDARIAEAMGCPVVGDFRVRDMAAGGLGAPLVPYTEYLLYRRENETVALQNIGGIGNVTILPKNCTLDQVTAFDTGPGNMVMDALTVKLTEGRQSFDDGGRLAATGQVNKQLLAYMLQDEYLKRKPPKTTGREYYGEKYVQDLLTFCEKHSVSLLDCLATATRFTAESIRIGVTEFSSVYPDCLIVGGGGSRNPVLLKHLKDCLPGCRVMTNEEIGFDSDSKEAVAFAVLANEAYEGMTNNVPSVTGALHPVVMGKISV
ncbi:MAG: anhydro-N-acetylmuramic acid kinase [Acetatifactor sp.]